MPYIIKKVDSGFKVCKKEEPNKCFSNKPLTKARAIKQRQAIGISGSGDNRNLKMFELFKGTGSVGKVAKKMGFDVVSLDFDPIYTPDIETDIIKWDYKKWAKDNNFYPNYIWASPPCNTYSPLVYPLKERDTKTAEPFSDRAKMGTKILNKTLEIIKYFNKINPKMLYTIENPRGMMRNEPKIKKLPNRETTLYCLYGDFKRKPTDFWSNYKMNLDVETKKCPNKTIPVDKLPNIEMRYSIPSKLIKQILTTAQDIILNKQGGAIPTNKKLYETIKQRQAIGINEGLTGDIGPFMARIGGKTRLKKKIVEQYFPKNYENMIYVEPFIGGGSIFFYKKPSIKEVINDKDKDVITLFRGFKKYSGYKISEAINGTYTKEDYNKIKEAKPKNEFDKFINLLLKYKLSFFGGGPQKGFDISRPSISSNYKDKYKDRLKDTTILNEDFKKVINKYDSDNTLFYLDPPYEKSDKLYKFDFLPIKDVYEVLKNIKGKFILSYNNSKEAKELFKNYNISKVKTVYSKTKNIKNRDVNEIIITNFKEGGAKPKDEKLYQSIKDKIYEEQPKHSLYRSARIAKEYKKAGGEYEEDDKKPPMNINKWFNQKWISINDFVRGQTVKCGASDTEKKYGEYPLCRPLKIAELLTKQQMKKLIKEKDKLKQEPLLTKKILDTDKYNIKSTMTGAGNSKFMKQLEAISYKPAIYLKDARQIASKRGYNPKLLNFSDKPSKKLNYNGVDFGQVNYNDFLIYKHLERAGDIPKDTANKRMSNYRARATNIRGDWRNDKQSPNNLAINILW